MKTYNDVANIYFGIIFLIIGSYSMYLIIIQHVVESITVGMSIIGFVMGIGLLTISEPVKNKAKRQSK